MKDKAGSVTIFGAGNIGGFRYSRAFMLQFRMLFRWLFPGSRFITATYSILTHRSS